MKTKVKIYIIAASLGFLNTQAFTASFGSDQRDHFRFNRINPAGQDIIVENNYYYGDGDYIYDYYYASRIRRFQRPYVSYSYYNSYYTDCYWYTYEPIFRGMSIYLGSMWNPVGLTISFGYPFTSYYRSYYYDPYPFYPVYNIVYRPRIVNRYYFNTWYGNRIHYSRPFYANRYRYHYNTWNSNYGHYSHSDSYAYNYRGSDSYRRNRVVPSQTSKNRDINRSDTYNNRRRTIPTNTTARPRYENRNAEKSTRVTTNTDVRRRNTVSGRTTIENKNSARNRSSVTGTGLKNTNTRTVTNARRSTPVPNDDRINTKSQYKTDTRRSDYVPRRSETGRSVYKAPQKSSTRSRVSPPVDKRRSQSYRSSTPKKRSSLKANKSGRRSSSKKVTKSSGRSRSKASKPGSGRRSSSKKSSGRKR